jgi:hypothetical protein
MGATAGTWTALAALSARGKPSTADACRNGAGDNDTAHMERGALVGKLGLNADNVGTNADNVGIGCVEPVDAAVAISVIGVTSGRGHGS